MKLKVTKEMEESMRETDARLDDALTEPGFRAEHEKILSRYALQAT